MAINDIVQYTSVIIIIFPPTFFCLSKPLFLYGSIVLLSTLISTILVTMYYNSCGMLGYYWWLLCMMVINVSVQYNGGLLPDIILLTQCYFHR